MCGRFAQAVPLGKLKKIDLFNDLEQAFNESYNVTPGEDAGIIIYRGRVEFLASKWGFTAQYGKKGVRPQLIINARSETVHEKFTFKKPFENSRCIIPVNGFYEWMVSGKDREPLFIFSQSSSPGEDLLFLAGLYRFTPDKQLVFTVITREAAGVLKKIHDRMPVCIPAAKLRNWLYPGTPADELMIIMNEDFIKDFTFHQVSHAVNNPSNKTAECIIPVLK